MTTPDYQAQEIIGKAMEMQAQVAGSHALAERLHMDREMLSALSSMAGDLSRIRTRACCLRYDAMQYGAKP